MSGVDLLAMGPAAQAHRANTMCRKPCGLSQKAQLKPHVMKLIRQTGMLGDDLPESEASLLYDRYFLGVQLQPSNTEDLDYLAGFLKALEDARMCVQP